MKLAKSWLASCALAGVLLAQPSLRITSPPDGTVVHPGQLLKVTVEASGDFQQVAIIGMDPIGFCGLRSAAPYEFTIRIPDEIAPRRYSLTAEGVIAPGKSTSSYITLQAEEPDDAQIRLDVDFHGLELFLPGGTGGRAKGYLNALGFFPDGQRVNLSNSTHTSFKSSAPGVAAVDHQGVVTAVALGSAKIIITYRNARVEVPVTVLPRSQ